MSRDLDQLFGALGADADAHAETLSGPEALRRRGDARTRNRWVVGCAAVVVLVGGVLIGSQGLFGSPSAAPSPPIADLPTAVPATPSTTASPLSPAMASATADRYPLRTTLPSSAFLQPADVGRNEGSWVPVGTDHTLPRLCKADYFGDQDDTTVHRIRLNNIGDPQQVMDARVFQTIVQYRADGAEQLMQRLRAALDECPADGETDYDAVDTPGVGDDAFGFTVTGTVSNDPYPGTREVVNYMTVVRVGNAVTLLWVTGWEGGQITPAERDELTERAVTRLRNWLE